MTKINAVFEYGWLQTAALRVTRVHFFYVLAYAMSIIIFDSWNLIPPEALAQRWEMAALMLGVTTVLWYAARYRVTHGMFYRSLIFILILTDIYIAGVNVYAQRGMASKAVMLFAVPLIISATLRSRSAVFATAALCTGAYVLAAVRYFIDNFNEGYKVELYGEIGFYSAMFFVLAGLLWVVIHSRSH